VVEIVFIAEGFEERHHFRSARFSKLFYQLDSRCDAPSNQQLRIHAMNCITELRDNNGFVVIEGIVQQQVKLPNEHSKQRIV